jgi:hypothetical protein
MEASKMRATSGGDLTLAESAARSLRRARKMYQRNEWRSTDEAAYHVQEAQILALMDLAQAVRETKGAGS